MMYIDNINMWGEALFSALADQSHQLTTLSQQALGAGIDKYQNKDFKGAAKEFKRAIGLDPNSEYSVDATKYLAMSYQKLEQTDKAIDTYKEGLKIHRDRDDLQVALGNIYYAEERIGEAIEAYEAAVRIYDDPNNRFALGQAYLKADRQSDAADQFKRVIKMDSRSPNGYFGLGQALGAQKQYAEAITQFERAIQRNREFNAAYVEIGYLHADNGDMRQAEEIKSFLERKDRGLAETLGNYINKMTKPKMMFAYSNSSFPYYMQPKTKVAGMNEYLASADSSHTFNMIFQFSKEMDRTSVENVVNWSIERSSGNGPGRDYNNGLRLPETEVNPPAMPLTVIYNEQEQTATVRFTIRQNATGDGTLDPSRLVFAFKGVDADGNAMNPKFDQYMGFSGAF
ncbi:tetratricopeptide repeat protein [Desulfatitalea alkaliphila]|uniref:Tetratricopeptide repeat protein n=1 Tax=Desulfatitalea alkaliphila TaxID=2929485 RepID=A0AA41UKQ0_9BACT|nr:tetratricopeptide repeat protein [Desulfatitalea alkaliphila]MCJ8501657.1 tetratricopeptide repeat protein [Desulfatitalea alkaliphila]